MFMDMSFPLPFFVAVGLSYKSDPFSLWSFVFLYSSYPHTSSPSSAQPRCHCHRRLHLFNVNTIKLSHTVYFFYQICYMYYNKKENERQLGSKQGSKQRENIFICIHLKLNNCTLVYRFYSFLQQNKITHTHTQVTRCPWFSPSSALML